MLLQVLIGYSGEKRCKKMKNAKGCFGSDVVVYYFYSKYIFESYNSSIFVFEVLDW